ncbi:DUF6647 family protein [Roseicyclus persicicus]|uniref:DUF6647 domain-containing protein n=1 Tax=Roseicyclus persicicus TaxID=2650661 RepID=A0A7X6GY60_9RHOB|nr:DUF6647 family protein [Roseibacterium persicicum]NKX43804.1 hypothetical protein [Roseibacterium persicicum]
MALLCAALAAGPGHAGDDAAGCPPAPLGPPLPEAIGRPLFDGLVGWIALATDYDLLPTYTDPPTVSFCRVGETIAYAQADLIVDPALLAAYDHGQTHIFLTHPWSPVSLFDQSVLLHELIHHVQLTNRDWACTGAPELEAYLLQDRWLQERGVRHPFDWRMILALSRCPGADP